MTELARYFRFWRTIMARDREIIDAVVDPAHQGPSPELRRFLADWRGPRYWSREGGERRLVLIRLLRATGRERWWLHGLLFAITFGTVWMGGTLLAGSSLPFVFPFGVDYTELPRDWNELVAAVLKVRPGLDFAMALMAILLAHESGHYIAAQRYALNASPPYFIPAPPIVNFIGTFGAFIRVRSPIADRRQLLDVGAAGPWAGFVVAIVALVVGLLRSQIVGDVGPTSQFVFLGPYRLYLGDSPIVLLLRQALVGEGTVLLHPLAFAGWLGMFVTMLNLLPLGQLDGGHVLYALIGRRQAAVSSLVWVGIVVLGVLAASESSFVLALFWWLWAFVVLVFGRGRLAHPQVLDPHRPLPLSRCFYGWATLVLFLATFSPVPIYWG
ncbi:MAG: site-2 protease family protein [Gemmatimonadales bacterium]|jgi:membrane-associated protease RseP (regulator of RpoE activity)